MYPKQNGFFYSCGTVYFHRMHPHLKNLLHCVDLEEKEEALRYRLDQSRPLKQLKAEGLVLHPLIITRKGFGFADYPEVSFRISFPPETSLFRDGSAIECFVPGEEPVKGVLLSLEGKSGEFRLYAPDFPEWIEEDGLAIKLAPDTHTTSILKKTLGELENDKRLFRLFTQVHGEPVQVTRLSSKTSYSVRFRNQSLNASQRQAVEAICGQEEIIIVHGPPGTGKTTTLIEAIAQLVKRGEKVLVSAPSNTAVDTIAKGLIRAGCKTLRTGNSNKADPEIMAHTPEGMLKDSKIQREIRQLKIRAEEFRRMALKYKRHYGKAEREQRSLLFKEVKSIRGEIRRLLNYHEEKFFSEAQVIAGTPVGIYESGLAKNICSVLVLDEAGQCAEPLAWAIFPFASRYILAGDHWQLPPTVLSREAAAKGYNQSILEAAVRHCAAVYLLNTQYRMRASIAGFSSAWFYKKMLQSAEHLADSGIHIRFIDTAGTGFREGPGQDGISLRNEGELKLAAEVLQKEGWDPGKTAFISPYSAQVAAAKEIFSGKIRISTIDSFQGQETDYLIVSLVRSNEDGDIGFLKDYRRMNVAITRAREQLVVIGDSSTTGGDPFYAAFLAYAEKTGQYHSAWEYAIW